MIKEISQLYAKTHYKLISKSRNSWRAETAKRKPLFVMCLHKSGTHLLENCLNELGYKTYQIPGEPSLDSITDAPKDSYLTTTHRLPGNSVRCACARNEVKIILNIRDPRDIFLSSIDYFDWTKKDTSFQHVNFYREAYKRAFKDRRELAIAILNNRTLGDYPYTLERQFESCLVLYYHPSVLTVRYEELIVTSGFEVAVKTLKEICEYIGTAAPDNLEAICENAYKNGSRTMNVAKTERWRTELDSELYGMFMKKYGHIVKAMEYPEG